MDSTYLLGRGIPRVCQNPGSWELGSLSRMALRITCPHCGNKHLLAEPFPKPGSELHCECGHLPSLLSYGRWQALRWTRGQVGGAVVILDDENSMARGTVVIQMMRLMVSSGVFPFLCPIASRRARRLGQA